MENSHLQRQYGLNPETIQQVHTKNTHCPSFLLKQTTNYATNCLNLPEKSTFSQLNTPRLSMNIKKSKSNNSDQSSRERMESTQSEEGSSRSSRKKESWRINGIKEKKVIYFGESEVSVKEYENVEGSTIKINIRSTMGNQKGTRSQVRKMSANYKSLNDKALFPYLNFDRKILERTCLSARLCDSPRGSTSSDYFDKKMQIEDFEMIEEIGKGKTSRVYLAMHKSIGMLVALKKISKDLIKSENLEEYILREIKIHSYIKHDNIISLYGYFFDKKNLYLVLEYMGNSENLHKMVKSRKTLTEKETQRIIGDVCKAVKYLHSENIIHRDLKLENTLLSNVNNFLFEGVTKISVLGCSIHTFCMRKSQVGSLVYLSPEQINDNFYNEKIDIWSIGIMTFELLFGYAPFDDKIESILSKNGKFVAFDVKFPFEPEVSEVSKDFISKLLAKNPNQRLCIDDALAHGFIKDNAN